MTVAHLANRCIVVVQDDYTIAQDIRRELEKAEATVVGPVPPVSQAPRLTDTNPIINAAVLDVNLGNEKSFSIAEILQPRSLPPCLRPTQLG